MWFPLANEEEASKTEPNTDVILNEELIECLPPYLQGEEPENFYSFDDDIATEEECDDKLFIPSNNEKEESNNNDECVLVEPRVSLSEVKDCIMKLNAFVPQTNDIKIIQLLKKLLIKYENDALLTNQLSRQRSPPFFKFFKYEYLTAILYNSLNCTL